MTTDKTTPMLQQYFAIKAENPDCLLFFRLGDFYEMFFDDAVRAAGALDLALTKRGQHNGKDVPMCGVPFHSYDGYLARLIRKGYKVAICEQVETPEQARKRGGTAAMLSREVTRVVTAGTVTDDAMLEPKSANYIAAVAEIGGAFAVAAADISSGAFMVERTDAPLSALDKFCPAEVLLAESSSLSAPNATRLPDASFKADGRFREEFTEAEAASMTALVDYVSARHKGVPPRLDAPRRLSCGRFM